VLVSTLAFNQTYGIITSHDNTAKRQIINNEGNYVNHSWNQYQEIQGKLFNQTEFKTLYDKDCPIGQALVNGTCTIVGPPPPPLVEICGNGKDDDGDGLVDEGCPITPPPTEIPDKPATNVNSSKWERVCSFGDIDNNSGLVTQAKLMDKYNCEIVIVAGDYCYDSCQGVVDKLKASGFTKANTAIILGNHDSATFTKNFNGFTSTYGTWNLDPDGKIAIFGIDGNTGFGCSSTQFTKMKDQISSSDGWYNLAVIHQPFVTVDSDHSGNGQYSCWNPLFAGNGVNLVLQAHNHNYQRIIINDIYYMTVGTGTHDTGSSMYDCDSSDWNGHEGLCITGTNGFLISDFQIDDPHERSIRSWFISNSEAVKDKFLVN
jgi:hypothetical protein